MRKILFITGSRGEYGYIRPILNLIDDDPELEYEIAATNMHLLPDFGFTIKEFEQDGFDVKYKPMMALAGYTPESMMKSMGVFSISITDILQASKPDIILLAGDRGEQFIGAMAGAHLNIAVAHIQAGEVSGNIDGLTRHAIARYAHIHFAANKDAADRLERSGEQIERIFNVGAPQLDEFIQGSISTEEILSEKYKINAKEKFILVLQHPVTEQYGESKDQMRETLDAVNKLEINTVIINPNNDAGSTGIQEIINEYSTPFIKVFRNVPREDYGGFLKSCSILVGNSSSGLLEAPTFARPVVNIGRRQKGRVQGNNVINCNHDSGEIIKSIKKGLKEEFTETLVGMQNPYGDGSSSKKIVQILKEIKIDSDLLNKELTF
tara:strand:- start:967 stop:2106 length:1140 start_codon:yes stop_codon:yes gene_type:complete